MQSSSQLGGAAGVSVGGGGVDVGVDAGAGVGDGCRCGRGEGEPSHEIIPQLLTLCASGQNQRQEKQRHPCRTFPFLARVIEWRQSQRR